MAIRIAGVTLPPDKRIEIALTYIYGIGSTSARKILNETKIDFNVIIKDLSNTDENKLREYIQKNFKVEGDLKMETLGNIKRLKEIKSYRGIRHEKKLPTKGQRTKTNSRTRRGNTRMTLSSGRNTPVQKT